MESANNKQIVLVSNFPSNTSAEELTIHFQRSKNGGGEVETVRLIGEGRALVIFEEKEVASSVLARTHTINGKQAKVEPYHSNKVQIFDWVTAKLNVDVHLKSNESLCKLLEQVSKETKIEWHKAADGFFISGTLEQLTKARPIIKKNFKEEQKINNQFSRCISKESISSSQTSTEEEKCFDQEDNQNVDQEKDSVQISKCSDGMHQVSGSTGKDLVADRAVSTIDSKTLSSSQPERMVDSEKPEQIGFVTRNKVNYLSKASAIDNFGIETSGEKMETSSSFKDTKKGVLLELTILSKIMKFILIVHGTMVSNLEKYFDVQMKEDVGSYKLTLTKRSDHQEKFDAICKDFFSFYKNLEQDFFQKDMVLDKKSNEESLQSVVNDIQSTLPVCIDVCREMTSLTIYGSHHDVVSAEEKIKLMLENRILDENKLEFTTKTGIRISVLKGDITMETADVIVNAANEKLFHAGGVAKAIVERGGTGIQDESSQYVRFHGKVAPGKVACTRAGALSCKVIIHAVGPRWKQEKDAHCKNILASAVTESLCMASGFCMKSIAFPPISAGIFGMPPAISAKVMFDASLKFAHNVSPTYAGINDIRFVIIDDATFFVFKEEFVARFFEGNTYRERDYISDKGESVKKRTKQQRNFETQKLTDDKTDNKNEFIGSSLKSQENDVSIPRQPSADEQQSEETGNRKAISNQKVEVREDMIEKSKPTVDKGSRVVDIEKEKSDPNLSQPKIVSEEILSISCDNESKDHREESLLSVEILNSKFQKLTISVEPDKTSEVVDKEQSTTKKAEEGGETSAGSLLQAEKHKIKSGMVFPNGLCFVCNVGTQEIDKICKIHHFCNECLHDSLSFYSQCPVCNDVYGIFKKHNQKLFQSRPHLSGNAKPYSRKRGKIFELDVQEQYVQVNISPSLSRDSKDTPCPTHAAITCPSQPAGHMTWKKYSRRPPGYDSTTITTVMFCFYDGIQDENHPHPGQPYKGSTMTVCLPNASEGVEVLKLFQKAFDARLLFTVKKNYKGNYEVDWNLVQPQLCKLSNNSRECFPDPQCLNRLQLELSSKLNGVQ